MLYLLLLYLVWLDMRFSWSGTGESNLGIWVYMLSFWPVALVHKVMGLAWRWPIEDVGKIIGLQALGYLLAGALLDVLVRTSKHQPTD